MKQANDQGEFEFDVSFSAGVYEGKNFKEPVRNIV